jgi:hypothetical protein
MADQPSAAVPAEQLDDLRFYVFDGDHYHHVEDIPIKIPVGMIREGFSVIAQQLES